MRAKTPFLILALCSLLAPVARAEDDGMIRLNLLWTNDIHGHVGPEEARFMSPDFPPPLGGGAAAAAYVHKVRAEASHDPNQAVLLVDAGDTWQGAPVGTLSQGKVMETYFNTMHYDAVTVGNHEFDKGKDVPIRMSAAMKQKFVCANIYKEGTDELVDWVVPYRVVEKAGLKIGIIGAITPATKSMAFDENVKGLDFRPIPPALEKYRDILKNKEHVDLVFALIHEGLPYDPETGWKQLVKRVKEGDDLQDHAQGDMAIAHVVTGIPVIIGGHTHRGYRKPWIDPVTQAMVFETFGNGSSIGHVVLLIDRATKQLMGYESPRRDGTLITLFEDQYWPDPEMADDLAPYIEDARKGLDKTVGRSAVELSRNGGPLSRMGILVTSAMLEAQDGDFAFTNLGGLRSDLSVGRITEGDLMRVLPFGNALATVQMDGSMIRRIFERKTGRNSSGIAYSGVKAVVDPDAPLGKRVLQLTLLDGTPVVPGKEYKVITSDFLMEGNSGLDFLAEIPPDKVNYTGMLTREALSDYIKAHSPVSPHSDDRFKEDVGGTRASYLQDLDLQ
jgi:2',3'-cyclic-nucleotide 2'-phosphodiesterase (5'-nucleotidase family)